MHGGISKEWFAANWIVPMSRQPALVALLTSAAASSERLLGRSAPSGAVFKPSAAPPPPPKPAITCMTCAFEAVWSSELPREPVGGSTAKPLRANHVTFSARTPPCRLSHGAQKITTSKVSAAWRLKVPSTRRSVSSRSRAVLSVRGQR